MSNSTGRQQRPTARKATPLQVMHQQARNNGFDDLASDIHSGLAGQTQRDESEVSREVSHLTHAVDELHLAIERLEDRLRPVMAAQPPLAGGGDPVPATESPLGGVLQGQACNVDAAIRRVHALMNAIRI